MIKPTFLRRVAIAALFTGSCFSTVAAPPAPSPVSYGVEEDVFHPVRAKQGMVASVDATATQVGVDILKEGGNAVDAAVAVGYALAVTHPQAGNLGGGGFMLIRSKNGNTTAIDFREMAPAKATRDMFLDDQGNPDSKKSLTSHLASGTPGTVAGFSLALEKYGTMPLNKVVHRRLNWHAMVLSLTTRWLTISKPTVAKYCRITKTARLSSGKRARR